MAIVDIARVITHATQSRWTAKTSPRAMKSANIPKDTEKFLDALVTSDAAYLLVGGIALLHYIDGRNTQDIDFILSLDDAKTIPGLTITDTNEFFAQALYGDLQVDLLRPRNPFFKHIFENEAESVEFVGRQLNTATAKGLTLLKLYALPSLYRQGSISRASIYEADITALLHSHPCEKESLLSILQPHMMQSDLTEIGRILDEISAKSSRFSAQ